MIIIHVNELAARNGRFNARLPDGRELVQSSRQPFLDTARTLIAEGVDPAEKLVMMRGQTQSLSGLIGEAARLTVKEGGGPPRFVQWSPWSDLEK